VVPNFNRPPAHVVRVLLAVACVTCGGAGASARDPVATVVIRNSDVGSAPTAFEPLQGHWTVVDDPSAMSGLAVEQSGPQGDEDRFPLAIYKNASLKNAEISLRLNALRGTSDQGGGLAVRLSSPQDYYLIQLDALRDRVVFARMSDGGLQEIVGVDADIATHDWHTLTVLAKDDEFVVSLDGSWVFTAFDKALARAGGIALWTRGDSVTRFDSIAVTSLPVAEERY
jgi:hypothetical protein